MQQGPSTLVAEHFAQNAVRLQTTNRLNAQQARRQAWGSTHRVVVGGCVRSYRFYHVDGGKIFQGTMWVEFGARRIEVPVTVVAIGGTKADGKIGARIVKETSKICDVHSWVLEAHFSTYCERLGQNVVVYEPFVEPFNFNQEGGEVAFENGYLTGHWIERIRKLMDVLDCAQSNMVTHGGLNDRRSYVLCGDGSIKLIDVSRNAPEYSKEKDLEDLRSFINSDAFFKGEDSSEWCAFDFLLQTKLVKQFRARWKDIVLGHPILQPTVAKTLLAIRGVYISKEGLSMIDLTKFANWLYWWWPSLYRPTVAQQPHPRETDTQRSERLTQLRLARQHNIRQEFAQDSALINGLFAYTTAEKPISYGGALVHVEAVNLGRNLIHHGYRYLEELRNNEEAVLREIRTHFQSFFSFAYSVVHTLDHIDNNDGGPYGCQEMAAPQPTTLGSLFPPGIFP